MDAQLPLIIELATCTRNWAEKNRHRHNWSSDLCGMCAITSAHLFRLLKDHDIRFWLVENDHHVFLMRDGFVLDVTATQFSGVSDRDREYERVMYRPHSDLPDWWRIGRKFASLDALNAYMKQTRWPTYQTPGFFWDPEFIKNPRAYA